MFCLTTLDSTYINSATSQQKISVSKLLILYLAFPQLYEKPIAILKKDPARFDDNTNKILSSNSDDMKIIESMWDDLGVNPDFRTVFQSVSVELDEPVCKEFLKFELSSLTKYANSLNVSKL